MFYRCLIMIGVFIFGFIMDGVPLFAQSTPYQASGEQIKHQVFVPGEIVIKTRAHMTPNQIKALNTNHGAKILDQYPRLGIYRLKVSEAVGNAAISYQSYSEVEYAQPNYIFAIVGKEFITLFNLDVAIHKIIPILRQRYTQLPPKENLLHSLVNDKLLSQAAKDENLQSIPEVQKEINEAVDRTLARVYQRRIQTVALSEAEIMAYYEKNAEQFQTPEQIKGRRILVKSRQEAEEILKLLKTGADFGNLARQRSIGPVAKIGGAFGWVGRRSLPADVVEAAFALQKGELSGLIPTQRGFYLIKVEDKRTPRQKPFPEVKNQVKKRLEAAKQKAAIDKKKRELEKKYRVKLYLEFLSEVRVAAAEKTDLQNIESIQMLREVINKAIERPY